MTMQIFSVGGAIRDALLRQPVKDKDWVVVGATPADMTALGYQTVGKDFPVFLHPHQTNAAEILCNAFCEFPALRLLPASDGIP